MMKLVMGLGNPGNEYQNHRHNVGYMILDKVAKKLNVELDIKKKKTVFGKAKYGKIEYLLLKPQTFMNLSGNSVVKAASFYKILPQNIVVIHDDMDLPVGKLKAKLGGGAGGHNGLKSIDAAITPNYNRIRIGVGHPQGHGEDVVNYVLGGFSKADKETIFSEIDMISETLPTLLEKGMAAYSNLIGQKQHS